MDNYRKAPGGKFFRNQLTLQGGFRSYVSPRRNFAPSFGSIPQNQSFNCNLDAPNFKSQSYDNFENNNIQYNY